MIYIFDETVLGPAEALAAAEAIPDPKHIWHDMTRYIVYTGEDMPTTSTTKEWATLQSFYDEFDMVTELGPILVAYQSGADVNLIPLLKYLEVCVNGLKSDHPKMLLGMGYLVAANYLTLQRHNEILGISN